MGYSKLTYEEYIENPEFYLASGILAPKWANELYGKGYKGVCALDFYDDIFGGDLEEHRMPEDYSSYQRSALPCEAQEKTRQTTKKMWYEPMAASSQTGTEACLFRTVQSKQCERQDQIYRRIKTNSRKKDGLKVSS